MPVVKIKDTDACSEAIAEIGRLRRDLEKGQAALDEKIAAQQAAAEQAAAPLLKQLEQLEGEVESYCAANRDALTDEGKRKFAAFADGEAGWRMGRASLDFDRAKEPALVETLRGKSLERLLRVKVSLDTQAILKEPEAIKGIRGLKILPAPEKFYIKPAGKPMAAKQRANRAGAAVSS